MTAKRTGDRLWKLQLQHATKSRAAVLNMEAQIVLAAESAPAATTKAGMSTDIFGNFSGVTKDAINSVSTAVELERLQTMMGTPLVQFMELDKMVSKALVAVAATRQIGSISNGRSAVAIISAAMAQLDFSAKEHVLVPAAESESTATTETTVDDGSKCISIDPEEDAKAEGGIKPKAATQVEDDISAAEPLIELPFYPEEG